MATKLTIDSLQAEMRQKKSRSRDYPERESSWLLVKNFKSLAN
jgi:hypothetical protein